MLWTQQSQPGRTEDRTRQSRERSAGHRTFPVGLLYVITIIVVLAMASRL